jgi:hypothetical protein
MKWAGGCCNSPGPWVPPAYTGVSGDDSRPAPFGAGLLPAPRIRWHGVDLRPLKATPVDDDAWYMTDAEYDRLAGEAEAQAAYEGGVLIPWATADMIAGTTLVGHDS